MTVPSLTLRHLGADSTFKNNNQTQKSKLLKKGHEMSERPWTHQQESLSGWKMFSSDEKFQQFVVLSWFSHLHMYVCYCCCCCCWDQSSTMSPSTQNILIINLSFLNQKLQTFAGCSFSNVKIWCFSLSFMIVNIIKTVSLSCN